jgi:hypothetical protein
MEDKTTLTIDLSEEEEEGTIDKIARPKQVIYWPNFLTRRIGGRIRRSTF